MGASVECHRMSKVVLGVETRVEDRGADRLLEVQNAEAPNDQQILGEVR